MRQSLSIKNIKKIDKSDILSGLMDFPLQCIASQDIAGHARFKFEKRDFKNILFLGQGGSAIGMHLVKSYLFQMCPLPMFVCSEPAIPGWVNKDTLVFAASYSGETKETLSAYEQARNRSATIIALSSGGGLKGLADKDGVTFIEIPKGLFPRFALGYLSIIPLCILSRLGIIEGQTPLIQETVSVLEDLRDKCLSPEIAQKDNIAKSIAARLFNRFIFIYAPSLYFDVAALRLRFQLNENSKTLASSHLFPEFNHNEIEGWHNPKKIFKNLATVIFKDATLSPYIKQGMSLAEEVLNKEGIELITIHSRGSGLLSRIYSLIYISDFVSFYLAVIYGVDPSITGRISFLKTQLSQIQEHEGIDISSRICC